MASVDISTTILLFARRIAVLAGSVRLLSAFFMSQPVLTQVLRKLEETASMPLFERAECGVTETAGGAV
ncbi:MAG: LysR family transcriptional regulator [Steroidobacteraceae bacterium]